jgi:hypothetical protein
MALQKPPLPVSNHEGVAIGLLRVHCKHKYVVLLLLGGVTASESAYGGRDKKMFDCRC